MKKVGLLIIGLCSHLLMFAQIASLYAGLSGIVAKKSEVDVELLTQIIVDKQQEVKKEFARRTILNEVNKGSYAFSSFANQSFDILFNTTNKTAASRKLIESSANLALSYGFAEFYLQASRRLLKNKDLADVFLAADTTIVSLSEKQKWLLYLSVIDSTTKQVAWDGKNLASIAPKTILNEYLELSRAKHISKTEQINRKAIDSSSIDGLVAMVNDSVIYKQILSEYPEMLTVVYSQYNKMMPGSNSNIYMLDKLKPDDSKSQYALNVLLIDLFFDVLLNTEQVAGLGFYTSESSVNYRQYQLGNKYINYTNANPNTALTAALKKLYARVLGEVHLLFKTYTLIHDIAQKELSISQMLKLYAPYHNDTSFDKACNEILGLQANLSKFNTTVKGSFSLDSLILETNELFTRIKQISFDITSLKKDSSQFIASGYKNDDLLYFSRKAYPTITKLSFVLNGVDKSYVNYLDTVYRYLLYTNINYLNSQLMKQNSALAYQKVNAFSDFVSLLTNLNDLDKASSYEAILNIIQNAGAIYGNPSQVKAINCFVNNIEKYTTINTQKNEIYVDVESIILAIYNRYANQENHRLDFYFSLGLNQSFSLGSGFKNIALDTLNTLGFAAEKIGLKLKLINFKNIRSYEPGEEAPIIFCVKKKIKDGEVRSRVPIVSDIHALLFGSGLLYNIVNTKTSTQFSSYLLGFGLGVSLYNGLDAHICVNYPLGVDAPFREVFLPSNQFQLFTFSFDIKLGEYLAALAKKKSSK